MTSLMLLLPKFLAKIREIKEISLIKIAKGEASYFTSGYFILAKFNYLAITSFKYRPV
jgi:hypothetical protein